MDWGDVKILKEGGTPDGVYFNLVGMTFTDFYPQSLLKHRTDFHDVVVTLQRDPDNVYDPNAIRVLFDGEFVGHVPRDVAVDLAREIDCGIAQGAEVTAINVTPGKEDNPGATLRVKRI